MTDTARTAPTTYAYYTDFEGAAAPDLGPTHDGSGPTTCALYEFHKSIELPSTVDYGSLIVPLPTGGIHNSSNLISPVLQYLGNLTTVEQQMGYNTLSSCVPLISPTPLPPVCVSTSVSVTTISSCLPGSENFTCLQTPISQVISKTVPVPAAASSTTYTIPGPAFSSATKAATVAVSHTSARSLTTLTAPATYTTVGGNPPVPDQLPPDTTSIPPYMPTPTLPIDSNPPPPPPGHESSSKGNPDPSSQTQIPPQPQPQPDTTPGPSGNSNPGPQNPGQGNSVTSPSPGWSGTTGGQGPQPGGSTPQNSLSVLIPAVISAALPGLSPSTSVQGGGGDHAVGGSGPPTTISLLPGGSSIVIDGSTQPIATPSGAPGALPVVAIGSSTYTQGPSGLVIGTQTLQPGNAITISASPNPTSTGNVVIGSATLGATAIGHGVVVLGGQTLTPGGSTHTINGQVVSAVNNGAGVGVVVGTGTAASTEIVGNALTTPAAGSPTQVGKVTIGSTTVDATEVGSAVIIGSQTLTAGSSAQTINGQVVSIVSNNGGLAIVVGTGAAASTEPFSGTITSPESSNPTLTGRVVIGSVTVDATEIGSVVIIGSQTLTAGGPAQTIDGQLVSAVNNGQAVAVGTGAAATTEVIASTRTSGKSTASRTASVTSASAPGPSGGSQTGAAGRPEEIGWIAALVLGMGLAVVMM